jgi:hypothetical protein
MQNSKVINYSSDLTIRCIWEKGEWWFFIEDVIKVLTESPAPNLYWQQLKTHIVFSRSNNVLISLLSLKIMTIKVKRKPFDYTNKEGIFIFTEDIPLEESQKMEGWLNSLDLSPPLDL